MAGHRVVAAHAGFEARGHGLKQLVTDMMTQAVIDEFELVEIDEGDRDLRLVAFGRNDRLLEAILQAISVGQACQRIVIGLILSPGLVSFMRG
jgi:hypothetical protein